MYQVHHPHCFSLTVTCTYMYIHIHIMYWPRLFFVVFHKVQILTMMMFVGLQSFISLPGFIFVSAAVSEIHDLNQNKNNNLNTFPGQIHVTDPFFNQSYLLDIHVLTH